MASALFLTLAGVARADVSDSGNLTINGQGLIAGTMTVQGNAFSVGASTLAATGGKVGIGTASPGFLLDLQNASANGSLQSTTGTNPVYWRYVNTGGTGYIGVENSAGNGIIGTSGLAYALALNAPGTNRAIQLATNNTARLTVDQYGDVGINTNSPATGLQVAATLNTAYDPTASYNSPQESLNSIECTNFDTTNQSFCQLILRVSANSAASAFRLVAIRTSAANADLAIVGRGGSNQYEIARFSGTNGNLGIGTNSPASPFYLDISSAAHATSFVSSSDGRFKENIRPLDHVLDKLSRIRGISFDWNARYKKMKRATVGRQIGVIAQEVEKEFPELVVKWDAPDPDNPKARVSDYRGMDYNRFTAVLLEAIKEQQAEIESLKARLSSLEKK